MLTRELAIAVYEGKRVFPDRLTTRTHRQYPGYAQQMCEVYAMGVGKTRRELHRQIHEIFKQEPDCPPRRIDGFCKLLDEASHYERDKAGEAAKLRQQVFRAAAPLHPLVSDADPWFEHDERKTKELIAQSLGKSWPEIDRQLFADIMELHRLEAFIGFEDPKRLLARYNLAQTQVALFDATRLTVWASHDFKSIVRYAKLARLMHVISRTDSGGFRFDFSGPASILTHTHRYGVSMAKFLPGLLSCRGWKLRATLHPARWRGTLYLDLDAQSGLASHVLPPEEFDSHVEEAFWQRWGDQPRNGWTLSRESELLQQGRLVFTPDFSLRHESGRVVHLEIVGFWTPEYLQHKMATIQKFADQRILLAVAEINKAAIDTADSNVLFYKTAIKLDEVLTRLDVCR